MVNTEQEKQLVNMLYNEHVVNNVPWQESALYLQLLIEFLHDDFKLQEIMTVQEQNAEKQWKRRKLKTK